jgi:hypothetical protein
LTGATVKGTFSKQRNSSPTDLINKNKKAGDTTKTVLPTTKVEAQEK